MQVRIFPDASGLAKAAAEEAAKCIRGAIETQGTARIIAASAASQVDFLAALVAQPGIDWTRIALFQLDEYLELPSTHPASFSRFLQEHLVGPTGIQNFHFLDGMLDPFIVIREVGRELVALPIDVAFAGIGENGHLAFNDPPADFDTEEPYVVVTLDNACREQQVSEGWFRTVAQVPEQAISMSIRQILRARKIIAVVPDLRKARAVQDCVEGEVGPLRPASALRTHPDATVYLDRQSASFLLYAGATR